jgi:hypothetical protein
MVGGESALRRTETDDGTAGIRDIRPPPGRPTKATSSMFRILKYAAVAVPVISRFLKSPRGKKLMARAKAKLGGSNTSRTRGR